MAKVTYEEMLAQQGACECVMLFVHDGIKIDAQYHDGDFNIYVFKDEYVGVEAVIISKYVQNHSIVVLPDQFIDTDKTWSDFTLDEIFSILGVIA
jgi:hypothetical protein